MSIHHTFLVGKSLFVARAVLDLGRLVFVGCVVLKFFRFEVTGLVGEFEVDALELRIRKFNS